MGERERAHRSGSTGIASYPKGSGNQFRKKNLMAFNIADRNKLAGALVLMGLLVPFNSFSQKKAKDRPLVQDPGSACDTSNWKLVFHDEFDGNGLDNKKWITYYPYSDDGSDKCVGCRYSVGSNSVFMDDQVLVGKGLLELSVENRPVEWYGNHKDNAASVIRSIGKAEFGFGRFEMRCRLPEGKGLWPAFWLFGGQTEIDIFEICSERSKWVKASLHRWGEPRSSNTGKHKGEDHSADFHTFAVEWERDELRWYVDNEQIYVRGRYTDENGKPLDGCDREPGTNRLAPYFPRPEDKVNVIADLAVSDPKGYCKGPKQPAPWGTESSLVVDWIRVYQREPQEGLEDLCNVPRQLTAINGDGPMGPNEQRSLEVQGPHGTLQWQVGEGLQVVGRSEHSVTVSSSGTKGPTWVRATSQDDPCPRGPINLETEIKLTAR